MQKGVLKLGGVVSIMSLLLLLRVPTWATRVDARQQQKDALLIDAIKLNKTNNVVRLLAQGASPNAQYKPMTGDEMMSAITQNTWPLRPKHMNLGSPPPKQVAAERNNKLTGGETTISALAVALDTTLDCPSDSRLPPRHTALVKALIEAGADVNARGCFNRTPLLLAMYDDRNDIVPLLLARHADVFARDDYGNTSLMEAASMGNIGLIQLLLKQGLNVNARNKYDMTPLMSACYSHTHADYKTVQTLLEHGADVNAKDRDGRTALVLAKWYANAKIVSLLKKAGAK